MANSINNVVSDLRGLIKQVQDDSVFTDKFLFSILSKARAKILIQRLRNNRLSFYNWNTFCIKLERAKSHNCDCVAVGCDVRRSVFKLPRTLSGRTGDLLKIETLGGKTVRGVTEQQLLDEVDDPIKAGSIAWSMRSRYLIVWNALEMDTIQVSGVWEDLSEWENIRACTTPAGDDIPCVDARSEDFGIEDSYLFDVYKLAMELIGIPLQLREDTTSNQNPEI
jgi:hypothetical protein